MKNIIKILNCNSGDSYIRSIFKIIALLVAFSIILLTLKTTAMIRSIKDSTKGEVNAVISKIQISCFTDYKTQSFDEAFTTISGSEFCGMLSDRLKGTKEDVDHIIVYQSNGNIAYEVTNFLYTYTNGTVTVDFDLIIPFRYQSIVYEHTFSCRTVTTINIK